MFKFPICTKNPVIPATMHTIRWLEQQIQQSLKLVLRRSLPLTRRAFPLSFMSRVKWAANLAISVEKEENRRLNDKFELSSLILQFHDIGYGERSLTLLR